jgi:terminal uridylyltransferase
MRATRVCYILMRMSQLTFQILTQRPDRAVLALAELCRERDDELARAPRSSSPAPRSMSSTRGGFPPSTQNSPWRSHSQAPFDRLGATPHIDSPTRRGRTSEGNIESPSEYTAQDLWLSSQGSNLGGFGSGSYGFETPGSRGRDTSSRGLETPGGLPRAGGSGLGSVGGVPSRRSASAFENGGSGSISAPLSPHRLYAQLEMGKGPTPSQPNWPTYDPRMHATPGLAVGASHRVSKTDLPVFAPFSPPNQRSTLKPLNGEMTFISPSTLLSPDQEDVGLPAGGVEGLAESFGKMGVEGEAGKKI